MAEQAALILIWLLLLPFVAALLLSFYPRLLRRLPESERASAARVPLYLAAAVCLGAGLAALLIRPALLGLQPVEAVFGWAREPFNFRLRADPLGLLLFLPIAVSSALGFLFRAGLAPSPQREALGGLLIFGLGAAALFAADLISFFLFLELMWLAWARSDPGSPAPVPKGPKTGFWIAWLVSLGCLAFGLLLVFRLARESNLYTASAVLLVRSPGLMELAAGLIAAALVTKLGLVLIRARRSLASGALPVYLGTSAAVVLPVTGCAALRLLPGLFPAPILDAGSPWSFVIAVLILCYGAARAVLARELAQVAAYAAVSQFGYLLCGLALSGAPTSGPALSGAIVFLLSFCFAQTLFFMWLSVASGTASRGLAAPAIIACAALCGLPPLSGFQAQRLLVVAGWRAGGAFMSLLLVGGSVLTALYCARLLLSFFRQPRERGAASLDASAWLAMAAAAGAVVLLGCWPGLWRGWVAEILDRVFFLTAR
jgi:formate hydrogenlyase subunit 3/multisubunit Na+/H+ antiporter MnhD subunit